MRKLLIGLIKFSGRLLSKLAAVHQHEAAQHILLAHDAAETLQNSARSLDVRAEDLRDEAERVLLDGRVQARSSREEAAQCAAIADIVKSIN